MWKQQAKDRAAPSIKWLVCLLLYIKETYNSYLKFLNTQLSLYISNSELSRKYLFIHKQLSRKFMA